LRHSVVDKQNYTYTVGTKVAIMKSTHSDILTVAGSISDFVDESSLALVVLASSVTASVRAVPTVLRAFCNEQVSHVHKLTFILAVRHDAQIFKLKLHLLRFLVNLLYNRSTTNRTNGV